MCLIVYMVADRIDMSENKQMNYDGIKAEIEQNYRAQLEDEVRKRKEIEEKYYMTYEALKETQKELKKSHDIQMDLTKSNRDLLGGKMSYITFLKKQRIYKNCEQALLGKEKDFWKPVFDAQYYAEHNEDVVAEVGTDEDALLKHFIEIGMYQFRQGCEDFNVDRYLEYNPDIADNYKVDVRSAYLHYIDYGRKEKRRK